MKALTEAIVDCHVHVLDPARFPYAADAWYLPVPAETGTPEQLGHVLDAHGVRHALLVGPNSGYNLDNRCLLDTIARSAGRYKGVAVVRNDASRAELQDLQAAGVVGIAFNVALLGVDFYRDTGPLLERLRGLGLWANVQVQNDPLVVLVPLLRDSGAKLVFDHTGRAAVKLSGYVKVSAVPYPHADMTPFVAALVEAYTPQALVWASDWPFLRAPSRVDYAPLMRLFEQHLPDTAARRAVLWDTPTRLFGFGVGDPP
jgi:predicted TIM-barrel fold metal-dependent hydrolase